MSQQEVEKLYKGQDKEDKQDAPTLTEIQRKRNAESGLHLQLSLFFPSPSLSLSLVGRWNGKHAASHRSSAHSLSVLLPSDGLREATR